MSASSQALRCFSSPLSSSSASSSSNYPRPRAAALRCSLHQAIIPSQTKQNPPPPKDEAKRNNVKTPKRSGIQVPRQRYISVSKSELLQAIVSSMFPSPEEYNQFLALAQYLDSILHAEHKTILEEMRGYYDNLTLSAKSKTVETDDFPPLVDEDKEHGKEDEAESKSKLTLPLGFTLDLKFLLDFSSSTAQRDSINTSRYLPLGIYSRNG